MLDEFYNYLLITVFLTSTILTTSAVLLWFTFEHNIVISAASADGGSDINELVVPSSSSSTVLNSGLPAANNEDKRTSRSFTTVISVDEYVERQTLQQKYDRLVELYDSLNRVHNTLKYKYTTALRKIRHMLRNKVAFEASLGKFLNRDQRSTLSKKVLEVQNGAV